MYACLHDKNAPLTFTVVMHHKKKKKKTGTMGFYVVFYYAFYQTCFLFESQLKLGLV